LLPADSESDHQSWLQARDQETAAVLEEDNSVHVVPPQQEKEEEEVITVLEGAETLEGAVETSSVSPPPSEVPSESSSTVQSSVDDTINKAPVEEERKLIVLIHTLCSLSFTLFIYILLLTISRSGFPSSLVLPYFVLCTCLFSLYLFVCLTQTNKYKLNRLNSLSGTRITSECFSFI